MKKIIFTLAFMLVSSITFANNSVKKEEIKTVKVELTDNKKAAERWVSSCTRSITNSQTGETRQVAGIGFGSTRETARANCHAQTLQKANDLVKELTN